MTVVWGLGFIAIGLLMAAYAASQWRFPIDYEPDLMTDMQFPSRWFRSSNRTLDRLNALIMGFLGLGSVLGGMTEILRVLM